MPTLAERILAHLATYPFPEEAIDVPPEVTQEGIAEALGARVAHVSRGLKRLILDGLVVAHLAHPRGARRRSRAHRLTDAGRAKAATLPREALAPRPARAPAPSPARPALRLHRPRELAALAALLDAAQSGGPHVALLEGDAGSGKSSLLHAFHAEAEARKARVVTGRASPVGGEQLLGPLAGALAPLGFDARYRARAAGTPRERALAAAAESVAAAARAQPVVVLLDDLHLAGAAAAEFLHGLVLALPAGTRALVVAAFRREEAWELPNGPLYSALTPIRELPKAAHVTLAPLDREGVARLLADAGAKLPDELVARVARESGGNPLYVLAMADALADGVDEEDFFPSAVQAAARVRLAALPPDALAVLQLAAVAGAELEYGILARSFEGAEEALVAALDVLLDRLLVEEAQGAGPNALRFRFEHPKVREAVLADLSATRRRYCEARVARAHAAA